MSQRIGGRGPIPSAFERHLGLIFILLGDHKGKTAIVLDVSAHYSKNLEIR